MAFAFTMSFNVQAKPSVTVDFSEVITKSSYPLTQEVLVADVLDNPGKELVFIVVDEQGNRQLIIYQLSENQSSYDIAEQTAIPEQYYRFDVTKTNKKRENKTDKQLKKATQKLYFLSANELAIYQTHQDKNKGDQPKLFKKLAKIKSLYVHNRVEYLSRGNFIQDLNGDAFDDVVLAGFDKVHILIGQGLNRFARQSLPIKPSSRIFSDGATYTETQLFFSDVNFDGKTDILTFGEGEMVSYLQYGTSQFTIEATHTQINEAISATNWWNKRDDSGEKLDQSNLAYRKLEELRDINDDDIPDLIVRFTKTSGVFDRVNDYEVYFGKKVEGKITYPTEASTVIHADGTLTGLIFEDINNDNKLEVLLSGFDIGLSQIIGALVTGSIDQDVYLFKMDQQDNFPSKPVIKKGVELTFSLSSGQAGSAVVKLADLNGDGLKDLVLSDDDDELDIYFGKKPGNNNKSFRKRRISYDTQLPQNGAGVIVDDLNDDGKDDFLMQFSGLDGEGKGKEFKVLFAK